MLPFQLSASWNFHFNLGQNVHAADNCVQVHKHHNQQWSLKLEMSIWTGQINDCVESCLETVNCPWNILSVSQYRHAKKDARSNKAKIGVFPNGWNWTVQLLQWTSHKRSKCGEQSYSAPVFVKCPHLMPSFEAHTLYKNTNKCRSLGFQTSRAYSLCIAAGLVMNVSYWSSPWNKMISTNIHWNAALGIASIILYIGLKGEDSMLLEGCHCKGWYIFFSFFIGTAFSSGLYFTGWRKHRFNWVAGDGGTQKQINPVRPTMPHQSASTHIRLKHRVEMPFKWEKMESLRVHTWKKKFLAILLAPICG